MNIVQLYFELQSNKIVVVGESHRDIHQSGCQANIGEAITATHSMQQNRHSINFFTDIVFKRRKDRSS